MENFRQIKGYEGLYMVDDYGSILSMKREVKCTNGKLRTIPTKKINPFVASNGYYAVDLIRVSGGKKKREYLHRIIYENFVSDIPKGMVINHKDGNQLNNSIENLECVTQQDNIRHYWKSRKANVGVRYCKWHRGKKWRATISDKNKVDLGYYHTEEEAVSALNEYIEENMNHLKYKV